MTTQVTYQTKPVAKDSTTFLRTILKENGVFSTVSGLAFIGAATPIATFLGFEMPLILTIIGVGLLLFAADLFYIATRPVLNQYLVIGIIIADVIWVIGSIILLVTDFVPLTTAGQWAVGIVAAIVALFAQLQVYGLSRIKRAK